MSKYIKKADYIELYGETAWEEYNRRQYLAHKKCNEKNKEKRKQYRKDHRKELTENQRAFRQRHKDKIEYKEKNRTSCRNYYNSYSGRAINLIHKYTQSDIEENRGECRLEKDWVIDNIFKSSCIYCGDSNWKHLGADRIDNSKPHTPDNCVCSCGLCNVERQFKRMSMEEFIEYRKTNPRDVDSKPPQKVVEINGKKVIKKVG